MATAYYYIRLVALREKGKCLLGISTRKRRRAKLSENEKLAEHGPTTLVTKNWKHSASPREPLSWYSPYTKHGIPEKKGIKEENVQLISNFLKGVWEEDGTKCYCPTREMADRDEQ